MQQIHSCLFYKTSVTKREVGSRGPGFLHSARCEGGVEGIPVMCRTDKEETLGCHRRKFKLHYLLSNYRVLQTATTGNMEETTLRKAEASYFRDR